MTKKLKDNTEILVIPDAHCKGSVSNERFDWLGKLAVKRQPEYIVCIGDWADMASLSFYDKGSVYQEGLRYQDDVNASLDALARFHKQIDDYNKKKKKSKKHHYKPKLIYCVGNHENRINRYAASNPEMVGHLSIDDLGFKQYGWEVVPYLTPKIIEGIAFQHCFTSGVMGKPIGGLNHAANLLSKGAISQVCGHSHLLDYSERLNAAQEKICALVVGCYLDHPEHYTTEQKRWWSGLMYLRDVNKGSYTPEPLTYEWVKRSFS